MSSLSALQAQPTTNTQKQLIRNGNNQDEYNWAILSSAEITAIEKSRIHKVSKKLRSDTEDRDYPHAISIGPYHRKKDDLVLTTNHKKYYLSCLLSQNTTPNTILTTLVDRIKKVQDGARKFYGKRVDMGDEEFVRMLILDGCFIIELLYRYELNDHGEAGDKDILFLSDWIVPSVRRDLVLLENQIPFNVLALLYECTLSPRRRITYTHTNTSKQNNNPRKYATNKNFFAGCSDTKISSQSSFPIKKNNSSLVELLINFFGPILPILPSATVCSTLKGEHLVDRLPLEVFQNIGNKLTWEHTASATDHSHQVNTFHEAAWIKRKSNFKRNYIIAPHVFPLFIALILLFVTVVQVLLSI